MAIGPGPTRRTALAWPLALGLSACAASPETDPSSTPEPASAAPADAAFGNFTGLSESVHSGVASPDGEQRLTVRLCRYPGLGLSWIWVHARTPAGFFSFVDHLAPCEPTPTPDGGTDALYTDARRVISLRRLGLVSKPTSATATGSVMAHRETTSRFGAGAHKLDFTIAFTPERLYSGLNVGRTEVFGNTAASVTVDGTRFDIAGPAQFHEQRQTNPRFVVPFTYSSLWGEDSGGTLLVTAARRDGYLLEGDRTTEVEGVTIGPRAPRRAIDLRLADGRAVSGEARTVQAFTIPIVGSVWRGHMITADLGGRRYHGTLNVHPGTGPA